MRKSYDYGHFVVYILTLIPFSLSFRHLKADFSRFCTFFFKLGPFSYRHSLIGALWTVFEDFEKGHPRLSPKLPIDFHSVLLYEVLGILNNVQKKFFEKTHVRPLCKP